MQGVALLGKLGNDNMVGPAFTLRNIPAREDIDVLDVFIDPEHPQRKGIETVPPGYVLVQDCRGDKTVASVKGPRGCRNGFRRSGSRQWRDCGSGIPRILRRGKRTYEFNQASRH
jgi:hypothetical protein